LVEAPSAIVEAAAKITSNAILDSEVVWIGSDGVADFDALHSRLNDQNAAALAFDLMALGGNDLRRFCRPQGDHGTNLRTATPKLSEKSEMK
jgi:ATP-dependent DNA ligase